MLLNQSTPLVSVIIPFYKQEHFLSRSLASLFAQTFTDWEVLLINDGSKEKIPEHICLYQQDCRVRYFDHKENKGLGAAFNTGLDNANGSYITYLPADDIIYKDHLKVLLEFLENNNN